MLKNIDHRSYIAGLLTGFVCFLVIGIGMMSVLFSDLGGLRRRQPQNLGCQSERRVALGLLEGIAGQLEMSAEDLWSALNAGKTFPELFEEHAKGPQAGSQQEPEEEQGTVTGTEAVDEAGAAASAVGGGVAPDDAAAATGS